MQQPRDDEHRKRRFQWKHFSVAVGSFVFLAALGCKHDSRMSPDAAYDQIEREFISGELAKAGEHSEQAYRNFAGSQPDVAAKFRVESAKVLIYQGRSAEALALLREPLPAQADIRTSVRQKIYLSIALIRQQLRDQAEQAILEAEHQCPEGSLRAEVSGARGIIDVSEGKRDDAARMFQMALEGARISGNRFLQTEASLNLGVVVMQDEHFEDALVLFGDASNSARSIGAHLFLEKIVGNIGNIYFKTGDFPRALDNYKEAEKQATELGVPKDQVLWLSGAGESEAHIGDIDAARVFYERALSIVQSTQNQTAILDLNVDLSFVQLALNNLAAAEAHIHEAARLAAAREDKRAQLYPMLLEALLLDQRGDKEGATRTLLDLDKRAADSPPVQWQAEGNLARIYSEGAHRTEADHWFRRSIETFQRRRSSLTNIESALPFMANGSDLYVGYTQYLIHEKRPEEALNVIDQSRAESLADGLRLSGPEEKGHSKQALNSRAIAARLQATILVYSLLPKTSYLWVITPTRQQFFPISGSETILPLIEQHTKMILASKDVLAQPNAPGRRLYDELVRPAQDLIKSGSKVFIVGDDALNSLNFETLQTPGDASHYWIEDVTITNAKSLQLLSVGEGKETRSAAKRILLMGDPVYRKGEYADLPNASTEITKIASHFSADRRTVITGPAASPEAYRRTQAGQFSYIHFVAHATANMTNPLDSAVVLSRDQDDASVYKLYARDILKQNLHADLVTVSACYGSGLRNYSGEGLVGLAWAFLRAGSHHVIGAMWEVSDVSTPLLMDHLYDELAKGSHPDAALRSAKLSMIHSAGVFRKPLYWAPFQLYSGA
jgi:CHAT domain-containing protein